MEAIKTKKEHKKVITRKSRQRYLKKLFNCNISNQSNIYCNTPNCISCAKTFVANLSGKDLSDPQILVLSKSLSFIPTARDSSNFELLKDFDHFCQKIRYIARAGFRKPKVKKFPITRVYGYKPKQTTFSTSKLEGVLEAMKVEISNIQTTDKISFNLSRNERRALRELICDNDLVINKADKGSTIVVQNRADYIQTASEHLNDPVTYRKLDGDPTSCICTNIDFLLKDLLSKGLLDKDTVDFCSPPVKTRPARLYFLKKIHKNPMGIRPIVSSCSSATENISQYVDYWLQPLMKNLPSYLKNTTELINDFKNLQLEPETILVTVDVKSLYTCIPHTDGIDACREALYSTKEDNPNRPDADVLICLLEVVLRNSTFEFNNEYYKQIQGTAMGTKLALAYANLFMGKLEHSILSQATLKPLFYKRYIDDILILWPHSKSELDQFLLHMNSFHHSIKFTSEYSFDEITFLDVVIYKGPNFRITKKLDFKTFIKLTNKQAYIHAKSFHPPGVYKGVAIGEMKRYLRTNSRVDSFNYFKGKHRVNLLKRGYSFKSVDQSINRVKFLDRSFELKTMKTKKQLDRLPFVTRFTPSAPLALNIIKKYWHHLKTLHSFKNKKLPSPMLSFRSNMNIKSLLVRARLPSLDCDPEAPPLHEFALEYTPLPTPNSTEDH